VAGGTHPGAAKRTGGVNSVDTTPKARVRWPIAAADFSG